MAVVLDQVFTIFDNALRNESLDVVIQRRILLVRAVVENYDVGMCESRKARAWFGVGPYARSV